MAAPDRSALLRRLKHCAAQQAGLDDEMQLLSESIEALIEHAGGNAAEAAQAFEAALSAKRTVAAAFSTALAVADEALTLAEAHEARISVLEAKLERLHNLATLRDPIAIFRGIIAARLGFSGWDALSNALMLESFWPNGPQRATQQLEAFLKSEGLSLAVWNGVRAVADAGVQAFHQGKGLAPALVLQMVRNGEVVPPDLASQRPSVEQMLVYLHKIKRK